MTIEIRIPHKYAKVITIFLGALGMGALSAISIKAGVPTDKEGFYIEFMRSFCNATKGSSNYFIFPCEGIVGLLILLSVIGGVLSVRKEVTMIKDWKVGLISYGLGWAAGFFMFFYWF